MDVSELDNLLNLAVEVAHNAGLFLKKGAAERKQVNFLDERDVKLQADVDSERLIRDALSETTGFPIIGEEGGGEPKTLLQDTPVWVVDPLDGTYNYLRGLPLCCVSIGLMRKYRPLLGVIYDFNHDVTYAGIAGKELLINGAPMNPEWLDGSTGKSVLTSIPNKPNTSEEERSYFFKTLKSFTKVRMLGSAAMGLAYVASGHADVYFEPATNLWDVAAGAALIEAAGGVVQISNLGFKYPFSCDIWAAGKKDWLPER